MKLIYLRTSAYAILAIGLINWTYRNSEAGIIAKVTFLVIPGLVATVAFSSRKFAKYTENKLLGYGWLFLALLLAIYAFMN